jgi:site-specific DNA-methyltransferase (adenine-specific)
MIELNKIYNCRNQEILTQLEDKSVQVFLEDMPYNSTPCSFEYSVDLEEYWNLRLSKIKDNGCFILFGQEPFSSKLRISNINIYKYDIYWQKERAVNVFQMKRRPGKNIECISVFYKNQCVYNPQKIKHDGKLVTNRVGTNGRFNITQCGKKGNKKPFNYRDDRTRFPLQLIQFNRDDLNNIFHPTQKPVELIKYLIKTYSNEGDLIFDGYSGSGTTAIGCLETDRNFICCESDKIEGYFDKSVERINNYKKVQPNKEFF